MAMSILPSRESVVQRGQIDNKDASEEWALLIHLLGFCKQTEININCGVERRSIHFTLLNASWAKRKRVASHPIDIAKWKKEYRTD